MSERTDVLQGTLALMILKTLQTMGPQHGYGIARRIEQVSDGALQLNQGTLYPALVKLEQQRWIKTRWGTSDNNRKAKFYSLTPRGTRQLLAGSRSGNAWPHWSDGFWLIRRVTRNGHAAKTVDAVVRVAAARKRRSRSVGGTAKPSRFPD